MTEAKVLILSSAEDAHAAAVAMHLDEMHVQFQYYRFESFVQQTAVSFQLGMPQRLCVLEHESGPIDLHSYLSIWHRRPGRIKAGKFVEPWIGQMVETEARSALDGMLRSIACMWVNYPPNDQACLQKLWQLQVAQQVGLKIPETLVTNKVDLVRDFFDFCDGHVIYKMISESTNFAIPPYESPSGISTLPLRQADLPFLEQVIHAPHLFQRSIKKGFDLRATIVGKKIFCIKIDSQSGTGQIDWRHDYTVPMEPFDLPEDVATQCFQLMERLGLNYGALDLVLSESGEFVFIEINCAGQYLWVENRTKLPISLELANLLAGRSEPIAVRP